MVEKAIALSDNTTAVIMKRIFLDSCSSYNVRWAILYIQYLQL